MRRQTTIIPKAPVGRILMKLGAKRISDGAMRAFSEVLTEIGEHIGEKAVRIAQHSGRKTVKEGDIKLAAK